MAQLVDTQMANIADYDCFSQVVFESIEHYKMMKNDSFYKEYLYGDHENFADTRRSKYVYDHRLKLGWEICKGMSG